MNDDLKALRRGVTTLTIISIFVVAYFARDLILPVMLGFLIALTLSPVNRTLQKLRVTFGCFSDVSYFNHCRWYRRNRVFCR